MHNPGRRLDIEVFGNGYYRHPVGTINGVGRAAEPLRETGSGTIACGPDMRSGGGRRSRGYNVESGVRLVCLCAWTVDGGGTINF